MKVEVDKKILDKIEKLTITDYEIEDNKVPVENVEAILEDLLLEIERLEERIEDLDDYLKENLSKLENVYINSNDICIPHMLNISVVGIKPETFLHALEKYEVYISTQTACSSEKAISQSVLSLTQDEERAKSSLRISLSYKTTKEEKKPNWKQFIINAALLTAFLGLFIPSTYVAASPQEYILNNLYFNPLYFILSSFLMAAGLFMIWTFGFYLLSNSKTKMILEKVLFIYSVASLVDYMFFGLKLGIISYSLVYETGLRFSKLEQIINIAVIVLICLFLTFAYKKIKS